MLSDPHRRRDPFSTSWLPLFQPISPARQPLLPPPPSPLWTAKRGADIADPNYREKNSKRRGGCHASRRCNNPPDRRISTPPSPPFFNLFFFLSFFFNIHFSRSLSLPFLFLFIPANMAELREARPGQAPRQREYQRPFFSPFSLSLFLQCAFFPSLFISRLLLNLLPPSSFSVCIEEGHRYRDITLLSRQDFTV